MRTLGFASFVLVVEFQFSLVAQLTVTGDATPAESVRFVAGPFDPPFVPFALFQCVRATEGAPTKSPALSGVVTPPLFALPLKLIETVSPARYVNPPAKVPICPSVLVTTTFLLPVEMPGGVVAVMVEALVTATPVQAMPSIFTVAPRVEKFEPEIVMAVPPERDPTLGATVETAGAGAVK